MPEGPEIRYMIIHLNTKFKGSVLKNIKINGGRYSKSSHGPPNNFQKFIRALPSKIVDFNCKGKFIWVTLANGYVIFLTLGLTGHFMTDCGKYCHLIFNTTKGTFYIDDMRNFGTIKFCSKEDLAKKLKKLGPDILTNNIISNLFIEIMRSVKQDKMIGIVLLDQTKISGIGNYLRSDILYHAKISPYRTLKSLSDKDLRQILKSAKKIVKNSIKKQLKNGIHKYNFLVYKQKKTKNGFKVIRQKIGKDRNIYWVPTIQK